MGQPCCAPSNFLPSEHPWRLWPGRPWQQHQLAPAQCQMHQLSLGGVRSPLEARLVEWAGVPLALQSLYKGKLAKKDQQDEFYHTDFPRYGNDQ